MIDRLEVYTSRPFDARIGEPMSGLRMFKEKLIKEDEDIMKLKHAGYNNLYQSAFTFTHWGSKDEGGGKEPIKFYIFVDPRYRRSAKHRIKFVCNPNDVSYGELIRLLHLIFFQKDVTFDKMWDNEPFRRSFLESFRLGRVDFCIDIEDYSVEELLGMIVVESKARRHDSIFDDVSLHTIGGKELETFYIGRGLTMLRVYDKVKESRHRKSMIERNQKRVPERLSRQAQMKQLTRIEMQLKNFKKVPADWNFQTLGNLSDLERCKYFDPFQFLFVPIEGIGDIPKMEKWRKPAINATIQQYGANRTLKKLPRYIRRQVRKALSVRTFPYDLNDMLTGEIHQWIKS